MNFIARRLGFLFHIAMHSFAWLASWSCFIAEHLYGEEIDLDE